MKIKKRRNIYFATLYSLTALGSISVSFISPMTSISSIPAASVSTVAAINTIEELSNLTTKIEVIENILQKRKDTEVAFFNNRSSLGIKQL